MKLVTVLFVAFLCSFTGYSQTAETSYLRNFIGGQLGGQFSIGVFYEGAIVCKKNLLLNGQLGIGLNISGDQEYDGTRATYALQPGAVMLIGPRPLFIEIGPFANLNKSGKHTFSNLNAWMGLRLITDQGFFVGVGYTPVLYKTFTERSHYGDTWIGVKIGGNL